MWNKSLLKLTKQIWNRGQPSVSCNRARACTPNVVYQQNYEHNILINTFCIIYSPNATRHAKREKLEHASRVADLDQFFFFECFTSQSMTESMLVEFLHDIMKHATSRSVIVFKPLQSFARQYMSTIYRTNIFKEEVTNDSSLACTYMTSVKLCLGKASGLSILLPMTSNGIPVKDGLLRRSWSSPFAMAMFSRSAASTT